MHEYLLVLGSFPHLNYALNIRSEATETWTRVFLSIWDASK